MRYYSAVQGNASDSFVFITFVIDAIDRVQVKQ
jgi:tRNA A37 threonylcarbamoyladenosine dehydratase